MSRITERVSHQVIHEHFHREDEDGRREAEDPWGFIDL